MKRSLLFFLILGFGFPLSGYLKAPSSHQELRDPEPGDFDYDLFTKDQKAIFVDGELLYWTLEEGSLDYALRMKGPDWGQSPAYAQGDYQLAQFDWSAGLRVAAGYFYAPKYWATWGEYTLIHILGKDQATDPASSRKFLLATFPQVFTTPLQKASSTIALHYNLVDWLFARFFFPNPHLRMRLFGGFTFGWFDQEWKVRYLSYQDEKTLVKNRWEFLGGGPRMGLMLDWYWFQDIYISAHGSVVMTIGRYKNRAYLQTSTPLAPFDDPETPLQDSHYKDYRSAICINFSLGPSWQKSFSKSRIEIFAGYEINNWFNLQEIYRSTASGPALPKETRLQTGMLTLQGLTARATIDF